jgi:hypothetical protein
MIFKTTFGGKSHVLYARKYGISKEIKTMNY